MSEFTDMQREVTDGLSYPDKEENVLFPLLSLCGKVGDLMEGVEPYIDQEKIPAQMKLDIWEFAVTAQRLQRWANRIESGAEVLPKGVVSGDLGDIGAKGKRRLAKVLEMFSEVAQRLRVSMRELSEIVRKRRSA